MTEPQLVFVHGRGQEGRDPAELRLQWLAGLNAGLTTLGRTPLPAAGIQFPFYGDALYKIYVEHLHDDLELEALDDDNRLSKGRLSPELPLEVNDLELEILQDMAEARGLRLPDEAGDLKSGVELESLDDLLSWSPARKVLKWLAEHTRVDQLIISAFLKDVAVYLKYGRATVLDIVKATIDPDPDRPLVLVSHSLGTVVARELLADKDICKKTAVWVTAGAPLGIQAVYQNMKPSGEASPDVPAWITAYDVNDIVATGHPLLNWHDPSPSNVEVENDQEPHSIERYLAHPVVAGAIGDSMN